MLQAVISFVFAIMILNSAHALNNPASTLLRSYNIDKQGITISGLSSGAFMALQMDVAFSKTLSGAGSLGGGAYWCAKGNVQRAQSTCLLHPEDVDVSELIRQAQVFAKQEWIDSLDHLKKHRIYIFTGTQDKRVLPENALLIRDFYQALIPSEQVRLDNTLSAAHGLPTVDYGQPCDQAISPWLLKCGYDGAGETLQMLYGSLKPPKSASPKNLLEFSQNEFGSDKAALHSRGWVYVPTACQRGEKCKLHLALHGCKMNPDFIGDEFVQHAGYNPWAEANDIIVLYPQAARLDYLNPYGCWDWFGYTGPNYVTKKGPQMAALKSMIDRLIQR